ncbi:MAG: DUF971 domain-containing protein, partial [Candidatus Latescibacteria bacterium]|nr:DUF971 domain-containing protein [Candidatus Latescibacterota bacterium]
RPILVSGWTGLGTNTGGGPLSASNNEPRSIEVRSEAAELRITWEEGSVQVLSLRGLRQACPCAECGDGRRKAEQEGGLHMLTGREEMASEEVASVRPVGRYAIQITWEDGHNTGIYTYDRLRGMG